MELLEGGKMLRSQCGHNCCCCNPAPLFVAGIWAYIPNKGLQDTEREYDRSGIELGATLKALLDVMSKEELRGEKPKPVRRLFKDLRKEIKRTIRKMPNRTLANSLFAITSLKEADKAMMSKGVQSISGRCGPKDLHCPFATECQTPARFGGYCT
jgi:hypothetical protein